jgi:hypothetical protein
MRRVPRTLHDEVTCICCAQPGVQVGNIVLKFGNLHQDCYLKTQTSVSENDHHLLL